MIIRNSFSALALLVLLTCLASVNAHAQPPNEIEVRDFPYQTDALTVPLGTKVIWINDDTEDHTVTSDDGIFHSGDLAPGQQFSYLFDHPGNYPYHCEIHPSERSTIQVTSQSYTSLFTPSSANPSAVSADIANMADIIRSADPQRSQRVESAQTASKPTSTAHITAPEKQSAQSNQYVYNQKQAQPYSQYQAYAAQAGGEGNALWIQGATTRTQQATVPQGERLSLIAITSAEGNGYLYETYPDGQTVKKDYHFYPNIQIGYNADTIGKHVLSFSVDGQESNTVVIEVVDRNTPYQQETSYKQQGYQQQGYQQSNYNLPSYQPQSAPPAKGPSTEYNSFWEKSAVKIDSNGQLTYKGIQGKEYNLQPSSRDVLTRGLSYNGVSYILVANPNSVSNTVLVNPQMTNWNMPNVQVMYGNIMAAKIENLLQITAPAYQSGLIIIQPTVQKTTQPQRVQKKRYSFTIGPKPPSSFKVGQKPAYSSTGGVRQGYSFSAGPKQPYSFRIGY